VTDAVQNLATIPSPSQGVWYIGLFPLRAYALCILVGIVVACAIAESRLRARGAPKWLSLDIAIWAVPFGLVGGRLYHVITSPDKYFGAGGQPLKAFAIWEGGLGIWGAVALGAVGAWLGCRRQGIPLSFFADALAPGLPVAQAIGRLGNWFNNELYGAHTNLPWGLNVYAYDFTTGKALTDANGAPLLLPGGPFHPTFLYELIWDLGVAALVLFLDRRYRYGRGRAFALYVMAYTVGRFWIESLRIDDAHHFLGLRLNDWVSILVFIGAAVYFFRVQGPQEHVRIVDDKLQLVTAEGQPIIWQGRGLFGPETIGSSPSGASSSTVDPPSDPPASAEASDPETADAEKK
jgi:prolipoprotein diacylglyceryl transferase